MESWTHAQMVVHQQWKMLYDEVEHSHLQQAIISHLVYRVREIRWTNHQSDPQHILLLYFIALSRITQQLP